MAPPVVQPKQRSSKGKSKQKQASKYPALQINTICKNKEDVHYVDLVSPPPSTSRQNAPLAHHSQLSVASRPITISSGQSSIASKPISISSQTASISTPELFGSPQVSTLTSTQTSPVPIPSEASTVPFSNATQSSVASFLTPNQVSKYSNLSQSRMTSTFGSDIPLPEITNTQDFFADFDPTYFEEPMEIPCSQQIVVHKNIRLETPEPQPGTSRDRNLPDLNDDSNMVATPVDNEPATSNYELIFNNTTKVLTSNLTELRACLNRFRNSKVQLSNERQTVVTDIDNIDEEIMRLQRDRDLKATELNSLNEKINQVDNSIEKVTKCISGVEECHRVMENVDFT